jgi:hypothetical protein
MSSQAARRDRHAAAQLQQEDLPDTAAGEPADLDSRYRMRPPQLLAFSGVPRFEVSTLKTKAPSIAAGAFEGCRSLTMSYFHTGIRTIIGAEAFHCPVRDGKEWDHLAMVIRHNLLPSRIASWTTNS